MRKKMEEILKEEFRTLILNIHGEEDLTQAKMASALFMDRRSLADIENGSHMCGELTMILVMMHQDDANPLLSHLKDRFELLYHNREVEMYI